LWGKAGRGVGLTTLPPSCADWLEKSGNLNLQETSGTVQASVGMLHLYYTIQSKSVCVADILFEVV